MSCQWVNNIYEFSLTILQESQNGTMHFSEYVEIILCLILDLNAHIFVLLATCQKPQISKMLRKTKVHSIPLLYSAFEHVVLCIERLINVV